MKTYSMLDVLAASPKDPLPRWQRLWKLTRMLLSLDALERAPEPTVSDWEVVSDAVNMLETLVEMGVCCDEQGLLDDAHLAMGDAGQRYKIEGKPLRLSGPGIQTMRAILEDYAEALNTLSARTMITAHRRCEARIEVLMKQQPRKKK